MAVTLQQIAEKAGVSRGTVDRALNNRGRINPDVADRIKRIADEMGYQPNRAGRALAMSRHSIMIGVIIQAADTPFMKMVLEGAMIAKAEVERLGAQVLIRQIKGVNPEKVVDALQELRELGCNGIAVVPAEDENIRQTVGQFVQDGIPVVTFNSDLENSARSCFVGQDTYQSGKVAAGLMAEIVPHEGIVQIISGYPSNQAHKNRTRGFTEELSQIRSDVQILGVQYAYDDDRIAEMITDEMLKEYHNLSGIYLTASGVEGVCRVLKQLDMIGKVKVISNDLTPVNMYELQNGSIQFLIGQNAYAQGYEPIMILFNKLFDGKEPEKEFAYTEIVVKTKYN